MPKTAYPHLNKFLELLLRRIQSILGKKLVGLYLYGSLSTGDFDYETSDIDLMAATTTDIDEKDFNELKEMQDDLARKYKIWDNRLEIAYMSLHALKTFKSQSGKIAIMSPGEPFHRKEAGKDWLMNWYFVREKGVTLFGPPPTKIITPISKEEFIQAVKDQAKEWRTWTHHDHQRKFQAYAILTICRALYAYKNGEQVSKKQAAIWAQKQLPRWSSLIQNALLWREDWRNKQVNHEATFPETVKFVHFVINQIFM